MDDCYISEEAMFMVFAALKLGYIRNAPRRKPRLVSIGTISITSQIDHVWNPLALRIKPLYNWFMGIESTAVVDDQRGLERHGNVGGGTSSNRRVRNTSTDSHGRSGGQGSGAGNDEEELMSSVASRSPHDDKLAMEGIIELECHQALCSSILIVRPTLLTYEQPYGLWAVRVGQAGNSALGYTISRREVADWLYYHGIHGSQGGVVTITT